MCVLMFVIGAKPAKPQSVVKEVGSDFCQEYSDEIYSLKILSSRTQAGPGRTVKQEQEQISPNHVQRINLISVYGETTMS